MKLLKFVLGLAMAVALTACGGGGGNPGGTTPNGGGTSNAGDTQTTAVGSVSLALINGAGQATNSISAVEIAQVKVVVKDAAGALVSGTVVSFSESGVGLLKFAPAAQTAMTTSEGLAVIEIRAADQTKTGATSVSVTATVGGQTITAVKTLEVTNAPVSGGVVIDPQTLASSINFVSTDPADKSIVLAGAGGNGRTETGVLTFRVVDKNNTPVKGVLVDFVVNPSNDVTLNIAQGTTDADGVVITSVSSKTVATSVVVKATVNGKSITTQSDQLKVTTGLGVQAGFEILPLVYNLDGALSGDSTDVTARLVDINSNPVADGVPVVFVATGGKIGTSAAGGCNTLNGACTVKFEVQEPRPANGIVTVSGSAKVGESTTLLRQINLHMSSAPIGIYEPAAGVPAAPLISPLPVALTSCTKRNLPYMVANALGYSAPSGTTLSARGDDATGLGAAIGPDNTVLDVGNFGASLFSVLVDPSSANNPTCNVNGIAITGATVEVSANAPTSKRVTKQSIGVTYPAGNLVLLRPNSAATPASITIGACNVSETTEVQAIGSDGLAIPAGATFFVSPSDSNAVAGVYTANPGATVAGALAGSATLPVSSSDASRQSLWLVVKAPTSGPAACSTTGATAGTGTITLDVTVQIGTRRNTQTVTVTYPMKS
ncbi:MAG: hypothetical protein KJ614_14500 [Gammaproteobacteria bacterium]|uniref:Ig-like domain-containing protein n=1 Tax=Rhodoferax sp. TaxID=50421 RepID=UPI00182B1419|nr:hypothetical protein [Rhodoferax sp.]MBU3900109.1 hypothetical protein [Gammaproteobacteria bacterium]MBA3059783.1 hypothetical protein [Rhodoferax sp.]MBU3998736.1 hypothetical protein [Gammaproteobacteria bacterium]MBU4018293.1 hypothetical protein [Gammaproteobacteria bacterium]MBU4082147.1 hypothetical protein [Gammaproteobacteria bacterium]